MRRGAKFVLVLAGLAAAFLVPATIAADGNKSGDPPSFLEGFKVSGLIRFRPEFKYNYDFNKTTDDINEFVGQKVQLGIHKNFTKDITAKIVIQDARVWGGQPGSATGLNTANANTSESTDIREAWFEVRNLLGPVGLQVGRQRLIYGDQRLVGHLDWTNVGRSFDGLRFKYDSSFLKSHVWATVIAESDSDTVGNSSTATLDDAYFTGWYNTLKFGKHLHADLYYMGVHKKWIQRTAAITTLSGAAVSSKDRSQQRDNLYTFGTRLTNRTNKKKAPGALDWTVEYAYQTGKTGQFVNAGWDTAQVVVPLPTTLFDATNNPCRTAYTNGGCRLYTEKQVYDAYAFAANIGYTVAKTFRFGAEYSLGSGDPNSNDGSVGTFNNLFHTNHLHYGQADQVSWRNMVGRSVNFTWFTKSMGKFRVAYWVIDKHRRQDKWYAVSGAAKTGSSTESASNDKTQIGYLKKRLLNELDLTWSVKYKGIFWGFGYSMIRAGEAITAAQDDIAYQAIVLGQTSLVDFTPTSDPRADFGYISMTYKF